MNYLKGTGRLIQLALRRDRVKLLVSLGSFAILIPLMMAGVKEIFPSSQERIQGIAFLTANPVIRLFGLPTGDGLGHLLMLRSFTMIAIIAGLISTFLVIRHTRQNEEVGRSELVRSGIVGRHSALVSALILAVAVNVLIAALVTIGLLTGGEDLSTHGSVAMGAGVGLVGIAFAGLAAVCAQVMQTSKGANNLAAASVAGSFLVSGLGSLLGQIKSSGVAVEPTWLIWASPFGWAQMIKPFADNNWWMLLVFAVFFLLCLIVAWMLASRRDDGQGVLNARTGESEASRFLLSSTGLTWRLNKGAFLGWLVSIATLSVIYGMVAADVEDLMSQAEGIAEIFLSTTGSEEIILAYLGAIMAIMGVLVLVYAAQLALRLRAEEKRALEFMLSASLGRFKFMITQITFIILTSAVMLLVAGIGVGLSASMSLEALDNILPEVLIGASIQLPAILLIIGLITATFAYLPKLSVSLSWMIMSISIIFSPFFSSLFNLPGWVVNISPLAHTPAVPPIDNIEYAPIIILSLIAIFLFVLSFLGFKSRDLQVD
ncbi:MAG: hypothetical protein WDZ42_00990 [Candidatus Saccharimonadales bacterium]